MEVRQARSWSMWRDFGFHCMQDLILIELAFALATDSHVHELGDSDDWHSGVEDDAETNVRIRLSPYVT